jgi:hypothetical protein
MGRGRYEPEDSRRRRPDRGCGCPGQILPGCCGDAAANLSAVSMTDWRNRPRTPKGQARPRPERGGPDWDEAIDHLKAILAELYDTKEKER